MRRESDTLRPGDRAPAFTLQDAKGESRTLEELLAGTGAGTDVPADARDVSGGKRDVAADARHGPACVLLVFDRGTW